MPKSLAVFAVAVLSGSVRGGDLPRPRSLSAVEIDVPVEQSFLEEAEKESVSMVSKKLQQAITKTSSGGKIEKLQQAITKTSSGKKRKMERTHLANVSKAKSQAKSLAKSQAKVAGVNPVAGEVAGEVVGDIDKPPHNNCPVSSST